MPPVTARDSVKGAFTPLGHGYKRIKHFCDNFKGIRENSEIPKLHEKGKPKSCMSCQMPPVTARDSGKGAFTPLGVDLKAMATNDKTTFAITLKESEKTPKYRNYMKRENLNLVCPAKCHPLQLETPERARFTPLGHGYKSETEHFCDNFKGIRENCEIKKTRKMENLNLVMASKVKRSTCDNFKGIRENCHETPERARFTPLGLGYKSETEHFCDNFKGIRENCEIKKTRNMENLNLVCPAKCHRVQLETPERARFTPLRPWLQK
ncbi:hypothetical protein Fcan01_28393 [Folsomia candida]|uniref:Uncharacterized protein n=1 Tax=Folsomia candida TaxID=158441 RepID=A0A226CTT5_FOLCA|nr:hypothetical protein Fcan01_28393 [Folsomia candida]